MLFVNENFELLRVAVVVGRHVFLLRREGGREEGRGRERRMEDDDDNKLTIILYIVLYCIILYCFVLYCIVLYCIVLYYIILYYNVYDITMSKVRLLPKLTVNRREMGLIVSGLDDTPFFFFVAPLPLWRTI